MPSNPPAGGMTAAACGCRYKIITLVPELTISAKPGCPDGRQSHKASPVAMCHHLDLYRQTSGQRWALTWGESQELIPGSPTFLTARTDGLFYADTCDWGDCDGTGVTLRLDTPAETGVADWFVVCETHRLHPGRVWQEEAVDAGT